MSEPKYEHSRLVQLLLSLQDPKLLAALNKDPDKVMIEAGITSEKYRNILKTKDTLKIICYSKMIAEKTGKRRVKNMVFHGSVFHLR
jgi:hypothetical protein